MTGTDILNVTVAAVFTVEVALGLTIIFGVMRVINMAHGEFFMLGAYTMVVVTSAGGEAVTASDGSRRSTSRCPSRSSSPTRSP